MAETNKIQVTLTTEHGTFTAGTVRAVKKRAAEAAESHRKKIAAEQAAEEAALEACYANGFKVMRRIALNAKIQQSWAFISAASNLIGSYARMRTSFDDDSLLGYELYGNPVLDVTFDPNELEMMVVLLDGSDSIIGYMMTSKKGKPDEFYAVGRAQGQVAVTLVPNVHKEWLYT